MKRFLQVLLVMCSVFLLTACGNLKNSDLSNNATTKSKTKSYQTTSTSTGDYNVLLRNGQYKVSKIAGLTATNNSNSVDLNNLESGLIKLSLKEFSHNKYVFQEGQELTTTVVSDWLQRYDKKSNPRGLNPAANGKDTPNGRVPIYLEQVIEQDYLTGSNNSYQLGGISIGLAMNAVDYYQKVKDGPQFQSTISKTEQLAMGKEMANKIVKQLRKIKKFKNIPIMIGIFEKTKSDSLVGGNYIASGVAGTKSVAINKWQSIDAKSQVLPVIGDEKAISSNDAESFANFKSAIQGYFPNISGVIGRVSYENGQLKSFKITVNTQFYGYAQINSFAKLVQSSARKFLPSNVPIEILVQSVNDPQAVISKNSADDELNIHVFK